MSVDVQSPAKALASDHGVTENRPAGPGRRILFFLVLLELLWIGILIYGTVGTVTFVRGLI